MGWVVWLATIVAGASYADGGHEQVPVKARKMAPSEASLPTTIFDGIAALARGVGREWTEPLVTDEITRQLAGAYRLGMHDQNPNDLTLIHYPRGLQPNQLVVSASLIAKQREIERAPTPAVRAINRYLSGAFAIEDFVAAGSNSPADVLEAKLKKLCLAAVAVSRKPSKREVGGCEVTAEKTASKIGSLKYFAKQFLRPSGGDTLREVPCRMLRSQESLGAFLASEGLPSTSLAGLHADLAATFARLDKKNDFRQRVNARTRARTGRDFFSTHEPSCTLRVAGSLSGLQLAPPSALPAALDAPGKAPVLVSTGDVKDAPELAKRIVANVYSDCNDTQPTGYVLGTDPGVLRGLVLDQNPLKSVLGGYFRKATGIGCIVRAAQ